MRLYRLFSISAAALLLGASLLSVAQANCGKAGQYCNGDPNHNASQQLNHAAEGYRQAVEAFDGSRTK